MPDVQPLDGGRFKIREVTEEVSTLPPQQHDITMQEYADRLEVLLEVDDIITAELFPTDISYAETIDWVVTRLTEQYGESKDKAYIEELQELADKLRSLEDQVDA